jgi:WD40 repeat protein
MTLSRGILACALAGAACVTLPQLQGVLGHSRWDLIRSAAANRTKEQDRETYDLWIRRYRSGPLKGALGDNNKIKLKITAVEGDDRNPDDKANSLIQFGDLVVQYGCAISVEGTISYFRISPFDVKGGGLSELPSENIEKLNQLITDLPDDRAELPPPGRRLVIQVAAENGVLARVFDRANAPDEILQILRVSQSRIKSWAPGFEPRKRWQAGGYSESGAFTLSPDKTQIIFAGANGPFTVWDAASLQFLNRFSNSLISLPGGRFRHSPSLILGLAFSSHGALVAVDGMGTVDVRNSQSWEGIRYLQEPVVDRKQHSLSTPVFISDDRYLLLATDEPPMKIFDTSTWNTVDSFPGLPPEAISYFPNSAGDRSVFATKTGMIALWNPLARYQIAILDIRGRIVRASFSPDGSLVALVTLHRSTADSGFSDYRLTIWRTNDGGFVHELRPFEQTPTEFAALQWWPNGRYLLAAVRSDTYYASRSVGIWNADSGRFRGELTGCITSLYGFALLPDGKTIAAGCGDGSILTWDAADAVGQIAKFENSLSRPQ